MNDVTGRSRALRFGDGPGLRGGRDKHLPACSAYAAKWIPIDGRGRAPAGALRAVLGFFKVGLLDAHVFPIDVKLLGDEHGQTRFDALTNLRILGHDGDEIVGSNTDKSERLKCGRGRLGRGSLSGRSKGFSGGLKMIGEKKTTTGKGGCFEKSATIEESRVHGASSGDRRGSRGLRRLPRRSIVNPNSVLRSEEHTSELQSRLHLVCRLLLEKKKNHTRSAQLSFHRPSSRRVASLRKRIAAALCCAILRARPAASLARIPHYC